MNVSWAGESVSATSTQALLVQRYLSGARRGRTPNARTLAWRPDVVPLVGPTRLPASMTHATEFIEAHAAEPIGLDEIAVAVRLSRRALQAAFRRHLDTTPLAYLRSVRLARVHAALQAARTGDGQTVSAVASAGGFSQLSRFARDYKRHYGVSPRETLHRSSA